MDVIHVENVRAFKGRHRLPLAPLTLLVGENSTGKTTLLSMIRLAWDLGATAGAPDFNERPFRLGTYDRIATYHGGQAKRAGSFRVGFEIKKWASRRLRDESEVSKAPKGTPVKLEFVLKAHDGRPEVDEWIANIGGARVSLGRSPESGGVTLTIKTSGAEYKFDDPDGEVLPDPQLGLSGAEPLFLEMNYGRRSQRIGKQPEASMVPEAVEVLDRLRHFAKDFRRTQRPFAMSPIRSEPDWIYEIGGERPTPEGAHAPSALSRLRDSADEGSAEALQVMNDFGTASGLFRNIDARKLGRSGQGDAFQVMVQIQDQARESNLVDVGYGVSQALPILVESLEPARESLLIQQPEVHLHPRAQAELGSLLCRITQRLRKRIVIETHSDYLIDRIRTEVRDGMPASDVQIVYLEHSSNRCVELHPISLDKEGNLVDAPASYRAFFLEEQRRFLGR